MSEADGIDALDKSVCCSNWHLDDMAMVYNLVSDSSCNCVVGFGLGIVDIVVSLGILDNLASFGNAAVPCIASDMILVHNENRLNPFYPFDYDIPVGHNENW